ncbi:hypothetical protein [Flavobacterium macacae]|uniref:7TM-DISM receptor extracellular domain-containing protein n=1 Tax=Flavobacterium macacae TaxID=2488993 RepID=A0A3P3WCL1_9FLAO|nr:hypothetical protein [Flavobacterium macacae]RRJ92891.1 hypothetical protein EG849_04695 [Flavobacterium macacae]
MKTKLSIILFLISLSHFAFGQTNGSGTINLKIAFDKEISIKDIDVYYVKDDGSDFKNMYYTKENTDNTLNIKGYHHWWAAPSFPIIVFSYPQKDKTFMFYLVSSYSPPYVEDKFNKKILFSFNTPNVHIYRNKEDGAFEVDYIGKGFYFGSRTSINELIKIEMNNAE